MVKNFGTRLADFFFYKLYGFEQKFFDLHMGTSTVGIQSTSSDFFKTGSDNWSYQGCEWPALHHALSELNPTSADVFVDLGCGKGKALLIAGRLPYGRAVGVEIDAELAECADRNIERARPKLKTELMETETSNVLEWSIPKNASTVFICNPFFGNTFREVTSRVFDSYDQNPRKLHIIYEHPWEHDWLISTGRVVVENVRSSNWPNRKRWWENGDVIVTYHVIGASQPARSAPCLSPAKSTTSKAMRRWQAPNEHPFQVVLPIQDADGKISGRYVCVKQNGKPTPLD